MAKLKRRERYVILECTETGDRNYVTPFKLKGGNRLSLKKYCPRLRKHTVHKARRMD